MRRALAPCPCGRRADSGRAVRTLVNILLVSQASVGIRRSLGGGWLGLTCPGPLGLLQQNTINQVACGRKRSFLRVWRLEVGVPGTADPGSGEGLTLGLPAVPSHARWCLSRNKGTNRGQEGLILMTSSPRTPPPRTGPSPWGCRFHHVIPGMASPFSSLHFPDETPVFWEDSSIELVVPDLRFGAPHCCQGHLCAEEDGAHIQKEHAIRLENQCFPCP